MKVKPYKVFDLLVMKIVQKNFKLDNKNYTSIIEENISEMVNDIKALE